MIREAFAQVNNFNAFWELISSTIDLEIGIANEKWYRYKSEADSIEIGFQLKIELQSF